MFTSIFILVLIVSEFFMAFIIIEKRLKGGEKSTKVVKLSINDRLILEKYTEGINMNYTGVHNYLSLISNLRFFLIQIVIASLQLLNRTQALLVMVVNLVFFIFFMKVICSKVAFSSKLMLVKECVQECCIMVALMTITLFSFTEKTSFSTSIFYQIIELLAVGSMIGAAGSEVFILLYSILDSLKSFCSKKKTRSSVKSEKKVVEKESTEEIMRRGEHSGGQKNIFEGQGRSHRNSLQGSEAGDHPFSSSFNKLMSPNRKEFIKKNKKKGRKIMGRDSLENEENLKFGGRRMSISNRFKGKKFGKNRPKRRKVKAKNRLDLGNNKK